MPFQVDMREGMSIDDALRKYNLTLDEAVKLVPRTYARRNQRVRDDNRNIFRRGSHFTILKKRDGKTKQFGTYNDLRSARLVRDCLDINGWEQLDVGLICALLGVERLKVNRRRE